MEGGDSSRIVPQQSLDDLLIEVGRSSYSPSRLWMSGRRILEEAVWELRRSVMADASEVSERRGELEFQLQIHIGGS